MSYDLITLLLGISLKEILAYEHLETRTNICSSTVCKSEKFEMVQVFIDLRMVK